MGFEPGDIVQAVDRETTAADHKSGLFYAHFRNLAGVVDRVYDDGCICVVVDHATITRDMMVRLRRAEKTIKPRWKPLGAAVEAAPAASEPTPEPGGPAADAQEASDPDDEDDADGETVEARPANEEPAAATSEEPDATEETPDGRPKSGLRYVIVLRDTDARLIQKKGQGPAPVLKREEPTIRVSTAELAAAESRQMTELLRRANAPKV